MPLFNKHGRSFLEPMLEAGKSAWDDPLLKGAVRKNPDKWSETELVKFFLKTGIDTTGSLSSYWSEKGVGGEVSIKVDLIALAAACAGCPAPGVGVFAEVGGKLSFEKTSSRMLIGWVGQHSWSFGGEELKPRDNQPVALLMLEGYHFSMGASLSVEVGVKTPDVPGLPDFTKGGWSKDEPKVEAGTYAELASFELSAKASVAAQAGIQGDRIYMADPTPNYFERDEAAFSKMLLKLNELGDKKSIIKDHVMELYALPQLQPIKKPELNWWAKNISGGNISTAKIIAPLEDALKTRTFDKQTRQKIEANVHNLKLFNERGTLEPYCYMSLWGMKPDASAGIQASAEASFKANAGIGGVEAGVGGTLQGPKVETSLKYTRYRLQLAMRAEDQTGDRHRWVVTTQDTKIVYGQCKLTAVGVEGHVTLKAEQTVVDAKALVGKGVKGGVKGVGKLLGKDVTDEALEKLEGSSKSQGRSFGSKHGRTEGTANAEGSLLSMSAKAEAQGKAHYRLVEAFGNAGVEVSANKIGGEAKGGATVAWKPNALNYMQYEAGFGVWATPPPPDEGDGAETDVSLGPGSGYAFGQSVDIVNFLRAVRKSLDAGEPVGYLEGLAGSLGVRPSQLHKFIANPGGLLNFWFDPTNLDPNLTPSAFLVEASFAVSGKTVPAKYNRFRWTLGPFGLKTLIGHMSDDHDPRRLQAIRLRYRISDIKDDTKTFSLGAKYIVGFGITLKRIERAGSEGIVNLDTMWFGDFAKYNAGGKEVEAYDKAVPYAQLLHQ